MTDIIEIREDEVNWAIGKLVHKAAVYLGLEKASGAAVEYITDPRTWTTEPTPGTARQAADSSVEREYEVVLGTARRFQSIADAMGRQLIAMGYVLEAENADLLQRVDAKLAEIDTAVVAPQSTATPPGGDSGRRFSGRPPGAHRGVRSGGES